MHPQEIRDTATRPEFTLIERSNFQDWWIALMELCFGILLGCGTWILVPALWAKLAMVAGIAYYTLLNLSWKTWPRLVGMRFDFWQHDWVVLTDGFGRTRAAGPADEIGVYIGGEKLEYLCWRHSGGLEYFADLNAEQREVIRGLRYVPEKDVAQKVKRNVILLSTAMTFGLGVSTFYLPNLPPAPKAGPSDAKIKAAYSREVEGTFTLRAQAVAPVEMKVTHCFYGGNERSFEDVELQFDGGPIEFIRFAEQRNPGGFVSMRYRGADKSLKVSERTCRVTGNTRVQPVQLARIEVFYVEGQVELDCPPLHLTGHASYHGCFKEVLHRR